MEGTRKWTCFLFCSLFFVSLCAFKTTNQDPREDNFDIFANNAGVDIYELWNNAWGWNYEDRGEGVWVNGSYIYTCGYTTNLGNGLRDMVIVKWDENGNKIWNKTWGGAWNDEAVGIGGNGTHIFTCGTYSPSQLVSVLALVAWDADGNVVWNRTYGSNLCSGEGIFVNGSYIYTCADVYDSGGKKDEIALIKWDMTGNLVWDHTWGGNDVEFVRGMYVNGSAIYTCGDTRSFGNGDYDSVLIKWDINGNVLWNNTWGGGAADIGTDVCVNASGIYTVGIAHSYSAGTDDVCVIRWDENGNILWNRSWGGTGSDECYSISCLGPYLYTFGASTTIDPSGNYLITVWDANGNFINATDWGIPSNTEWGFDIQSNSTFLFACGFVNFINDLSVLKLKPQLTQESPIITLFNPIQLNWYVPGQEILCNVTDRSGMGLAEVKYFWSEVATPPDWKTQGTLWATEPYSTTIPAGPVGLIYLHVNATDNGSSSNATYFIFRRDGDGPSILLNGPSQGGLYAPQTWIDCAIYDGTGVGIASVLYNWSTSPLSPNWTVDGTSLLSPYDVQIPFGATGPIYLHVNATDLLNNQNYMTFSFIRDGASPIIGLDNATENSWYKPGTVIDCSVTAQGGATITSVKYDWATTIIPTDWGTLSTLWPEPYLAQMPVGSLGNLYLHINATDSFGNNISNYFIFRRDGELPVITLNDPPENTFIAGGINVDCSISDGLGSGLVLVKILWSTSAALPNWNTEGSEWTAPYNTTSPLGMTGKIYLHVYAIDDAGNFVSSSFTFNVSSGDGGIPGFPILELICANLLGVIIIMRRRLRNKN